LVDLDEIKKRWGDAKKGSQYYADVHALMDEVERLKQRQSFAFGNVALSHEDNCGCLVCENFRLRRILND